MINNTFVTNLHALRFEIVLGASGDAFLLLQLKIVNDLRNADGMLEEVAWRTACVSDERSNVVNVAWVASTIPINVRQ